MESEFRSPRFTTPRRVAGFAISVSGVGPRFRHQIYLQHWLRRNLSTRFSPLQIPRRNFFSATRFPPHIIVFRRIAERCAACRDGKVRGSAMCLTDSPPHIL
uniref:Uncharacterized protein n=1 Tax=Physcomitrium patens TaxID=3218 RepID=A0A2K1IJ36_PHYPA|nr:hypothetical protein PHYPA_027982 [Physcomitrium patens]